MRVERFSKNWSFDYEQGWYKVSLSHFYVQLQLHIMVVDAQERDIFLKRHHFHCEEE